MGIRWEDEGQKDPWEFKRGWCASASKPCPSGLVLEMPGKRMEVGWWVAAVICGSLLALLIFGKEEVDSTWVLGTLLKPCLALG